MNTTKNIFLSYAHEDEAYKNELIKHLSPLVRKQEIQIWQDGVLIAGDNWDATIRSNLATADLILFLISADFMNSDYIDRVELRAAIANHAAGRQVLVPIIIRACDFSSLSQLSRFQALPSRAKPVKSWADQDEAWLDVVKGLKRVLAQVSPTSTDTPVPNPSPTTTSTDLERKGLEGQATLLMKKINHLKSRAIIETGAAQQFQLGIQIQEAEAKLTAIKERLAKE